MARTVTGMALGIAGALAWLAAPGQAVAQETDSSSDAAERAGAEAWFREHIQPSLRTAAMSDQSQVPSVPLEPPSEPPGGAAPERFVPYRLVALGPLGMLVLDGDMPQQRGDWSDTLQPPMFRLYFEPMAPPAATPTLPSGHAAGA